MADMHVSLSISHDHGYPGAPVTLPDDNTEQDGVIGN